MDILNHPSCNTVANPLPGDPEDTSPLPLRVMQDGPDKVLVSYWKPSFVERLRLLLGKPVSVGVYKDNVDDHPVITVFVGD